MDDIIIRAWQDMLSRVEGPMHLRFVIQPVVALIFAVRSGLRDAHEGRPPFFQSALSWIREHREYFVAHAWKDIGKVFIMAGVIDILFQVVVFKTVHPLETLFIAISLSILPYALVRGLSNRVKRLLGGKKV